MLTMSRLRMIVHNVKQKLFNASNAVCRPLAHNCWSSEFQFKRCLLSLKIDTKLSGFSVVRLNIEDTDDEASNSVEHRQFKMSRRITFDSTCRSPSWQDPTAQVDSVSWLLYSHK